MTNGLLSSRFQDNGREVFALTEVQIEARNRIRAKVVDGSYASERIPCPLCHGGDSYLLSEKDAYGLPMKTVICQGCGLVYTNPRLTESALQEMYKIEYSDLDRVLPSSKDYFDLEKRKGEIIFGLLKKHGLLSAMEGRLVVDIGCGAGGVLGYFQDRGYDGLGCDLVPKNLQYGVQTQGLDLHYGGIDVIQKVTASRGQRLGLVIYEQVFEHLTDPKGELRKLREFMPSDAILYVGVPGFKNIDEQYNSDLIRYLQLPHLVHFDLNRLNALLAVSGFASVAGDEVVRALYRPAPPTQLENADFKDTLEFLAQMERRRSAKVRIEQLRLFPATTARALRTVILHLPLPDQAKMKILSVLKMIRTWIFK